MSSFACCLVQMVILLVLDCPVQHLLLYQLSNDCEVDSLHACTCVHQQRCAVARRIKKWVHPTNLLCYREKEKEIGSLRSELAAARHQISVDERASRVPSSIDMAGMSLQAQSQVERLEAANAKLEVRVGRSLYCFWLSHYMGIALRCAGCMCCHQHLNNRTTLCHCLLLQAVLAYN